MFRKQEDPLDFTNIAYESFYTAVDDRRFYENADAGLIYGQIEKNLRAIPFGDYLKRYIYQKAGMSGNYDEIPLDEYRFIIRESFRDTDTPASFTPTTVKLSSLAKNWLTQHTVKRNVVFLLGFGLRMSVEDVNDFLVKALHEPMINSKNPFEVICWYCYQNRYGYPKFDQLWRLHQETPANKLDMRLMYAEQTIGIRNTMFSIHDDMALISHLSKLKTEDNIPHLSVTARKHFDVLYAETRRIIAEIYNQTEEEQNDVTVQRYREALTHNSRMFDYEKQERLKKLKTEKQHYTEDDITESDIEHIIYAAVPLDRYGNLTPGKASRLNEQFAGKRFSRQRIHEILKGNAEIDRFDLITMNFFIFSQKLDELPNAKRRYLKFVESTNHILEDCCMGELYTANPYECFLMMCILSEDPLGTYADVWELSYSNPL